MVPRSSFWKQRLWVLYIFRTHCARSCATSKPAIHAALLWKKTGSGRLWFGRQIRRKPWSLLVEEESMQDDGGRGSIYCSTSLQPPAYPRAMTLLCSQPGEFGICLRYRIESFGFMPCFLEDLWRPFGSLRLIYTSLFVWPLRLLLFYESGHPCMARSINVMH